MRKTTFFIILPVLILCCAILVFGQSSLSTTENAHEDRDPFIPLADQKGELRKNFRKPTEEIRIPEVKLMGISKINNVYYAIIEGEWLKTGDTVKELTIKDIDSEKVTLLFGIKEVELRLNAEKK